MQKNLKALIEKNRGYLLTKEAEALGISRQAVIAYAKKHRFEKVAHGIYLCPDSLLDPFYASIIKCQNAVFSHLSACYLHGLLDIEPFVLEVSVPRGYNATHLRRRGLKVRTLAKDCFSLGISEVTTHYGNPVQVYDLERTIVDLIKDRENIEPSVFAGALKAYLSKQEKNLSVLMEYAEKLKVKDKVRMYMEILL